VEYGWTKGGGRVDKGWRMPTSYRLFIMVLEPYSGDDRGLFNELLKKVQKASDFPSKSIIILSLFRIITNYI